MPYSALTFCSFTCQSCTWCVQSKEEEKLWFCTLFKEMNPCSTQHPRGMLNGYEKTCCFFHHKTGQDGLPTTSSIMMGNEEAWELFCQPYIFCQSTPAQTYLCLHHKDQFLGISERSGETKKDMQDFHNRSLDGVTVVAVFSGVAEARWIAGDGRFWIVQKRPT